MSKKSGIIIRLIDVVLILLMGFLRISDIVHKNQIKLPSQSAAKRRLDPEKKIVPIEVHVMPGDTVIKEVDPKIEKSLVKISQLRCYYRILENEQSHKIRMLENLEMHLAQAKVSYAANETQIIVIINPDPNSIVQGTINVIDICRKHDIKRNFRYYENQSIEP